MRDALASATAVLNPTDPAESTLTAPRVTAAQLRAVAWQLDAPLADLAFGLALFAELDGGTAAVTVEYRDPEAYTPPGDGVLSVDRAADVMLVLALASDCPDA